MSEDQDKSQKTEEPTEKKLRDAREKGQVATSKEINSFLILMAATILVWVAAPNLGQDMIGSFRGLIERPHDLAHGDPRELGILLREVMISGMLILMVPLAVLLVAALIGGFGQNGIIVAIDPMVPKLSKISPLAGFKRLFSGQSLVEFLKGIIKMILVGSVAVAVVWPMVDEFDAMIRMDFAALLDRMHSLMLLLMMAVVALTAIISIADVLYQRFMHREKLKMSKQEIKEEYKQTEGDPHVKGRLRQLRMEKSRRRMMQAVPSADVVVTNPTHFAVAMRYDPDRDAAPVVVAKGVDRVALRIRAVAEEHGIDIVEDAPLARALHAAVELDDQIPPEYFRAVAEIIGLIFRRAGRLMPGAAG